MLSLCNLTLFTYTHASFIVGGSETISSFGCLFNFSLTTVSLIYLSFLKSLQELKPSL